MSTAQDVLLEAAQHDWLRYRDSQCLFKYAANYGSGKNLDSAHCTLTLTIERYWEVLWMLDPYGKERMHGKSAR